MRRRILSGWMLFSAVFLIFGVREVVSDDATPGAVGRAAEYANTTSGDGYGIKAGGPVSGGLFKDTNGTGKAYVGHGKRGISGYGSVAGGYFQDTNDNGYAYVAKGDNGIDAYGSAGGSFHTTVGESSAQVAFGGYGVLAHADDTAFWGYGANAGGMMSNSTTGSHAYVGYGSYKIQGVGTPAFVQNHPYDRDKVIVYNSVEGDEAATYTRGTGRLENGIARVKLSESFQWVTNPAIGLTAHLTPRGQWANLYVESLTTSELVVRSADGTGNVAFDYLVYGLRIGFEEISIVQEKVHEAYIPSMSDHRERQAAGFEDHNPLDRFKNMTSDVYGVFPNQIDLNEAHALRDAIHEYDPSVDASSLPAAQVLSD